MQTALTFVLWILFGWITSYLAVRRGRDPMIWFIIGMLMGALGLLLLYVLPPSVEEEPAKKDNVNPDEITIKGEIINPDFSREWYYIDNGRNQIGPVKYSDLKKAWDDKQITELSFVWHDGMEDWKQIKDMAELKL